MIKDFVDDLGLRDGESIRINCPVCHGNKTFSVSRKDGATLYNCYKASCATKGGSNTGMTHEEILVFMDKKMNANGAPLKKDAWVPPEYVVRPTDEHRKFWRFAVGYGIANNNLLYDVKDERAVFPIWQDNVMVDAVGRALGDKLPKWYRYTGQADYYLSGSGKTLVIVEDVVSAIVVAQEFAHVTGMALLGTNLTSEHIAKAGEYNEVVVALDPDARDKTLKFKREIELWTGLRTVALSLHDDIKYRRAEDIEKLTEICTDAGGNKEV